MASAARLGQQGTSGATNKAIVALQKGTHLIKITILFLSKKSCNLSGIAVIQYHCFGARNPLVMTACNLHHITPSGFRGPKLRRVLTLPLGADLSHVCRETLVNVIVDSRWSMKAHHQPDISQQVAPS